MENPSNINPNVISDTVGNDKDLDNFDREERRRAEGAPVTVEELEQRAMWISRLYGADYQKTLALLSRSNPKVTVADTGFWHRQIEFTPSVEELLWLTRPNTVLEFLNEASPGEANKLLKLLRRCMPVASDNVSIEDILVIKNDYTWFINGWN